MKPKLDSFVGTRPRLDSFMTPEEAAPVADYRPLAEKIWSGVSGFSEGVGKGILSTVQGVSKLGVKASRAVGLPGQELFSAEQEEKMKPEGTAQKIGFGTEKIAELLTPGTKITKAGKALDTLISGASLGSKFLGKGSKAILEGAGYSGLTALQEGELNNDVRDAALITGALSSLGGAFSIAKSVIPKENIAGRIVNSFVKPLGKDLSYGKNPGRGIAKEGIIANNLDDLGTAVKDRKDLVGAEIGNATRKATEKGLKIDLTGFTNPVDEALAEARKAPGANSALITRLQTIKDDLLGGITFQVPTESKAIHGASGVKFVTEKPLNAIGPDVAFDVKRTVGSITKFTGNPSDDKLVNSALKKTYGFLKQKLNTTLKEIQPNIETLNERYADLLSAEIAISHRDLVAQRLNLISLPQSLGAIGTAIAAAVSSGGAAIPTLLAGATAIGIEKALSTPAVKTRVAAWLAQTTPAQREAVYKNIPVLKAAILRAFNED